MQVARKLRWLKVRKETFQGGQWEIWHVKKFSVERAIRSQFYNGRIPFLVGEISNRIFEHFPSNCKNISNRKDIEKYRKWFLSFSCVTFSTKVGKESRKSCIKRHCSKNVFQSKRGAKRISHGNFNNQLVSI